MALELDQVRVAVVTALPVEYNALTALCGPTTTRVHPANGATYNLVEITNFEGKNHVVAIVETATMGNVASALLVRRIKEDLPGVDFVVMCGIAGAMPNVRSYEAHVRLGDAIFGTEGVIYYELGKRLALGHRIASSHQAGLPGDTLRSATQRIQQQWTANPLLLQPLLARIEEADPKCARPDSGEDRIRDERWGPLGLIRLLDNRQQHPRDDRRIDVHGVPLGCPVLHFGAVASGENVIRSAAFREQLRLIAAVRAVEMEGWGAHAASRHGNVECLIVRGANDYCNARKNDVWKPYAAAVAAAATHLVLENLPVVGLSHERAQRVYETGILRLRPLGQALPAPAAAPLLQGSTAPILPAQPTQGLTDAGVDAQQNDASLAATAPQGAGQAALEATLRDGLRELERAQLAFEYTEGDVIGARLIDLLRAAAPPVNPDLEAEVYYKVALQAVQSADVTARQAGGIQPDYSGALQLLAAATAAIQRKNGN